jgi:hypothetical protein
MQIWGGEEQDRRSCTGFLCKLAGAAVSWESRKQRTVTLSSTEAEYMAIAEATKEAMYMKGFLAEQRSIVLYSDYHGAQKLACNPVFHIIIVIDTTTHSEVSSTLLDSWLLPTNSLIPASLRPFQLCLALRLVRYYRVL